VDSKQRTNNQMSLTLSPLSPPNSRPQTQESPSVKSKYIDANNYYAGLCVNDYAQERDAEWKEISRELASEAERPQSASEGIPTEEEKT